MGFHPGRRAYPVSTNTSNSISNKKGWMVDTNQCHCYAESVFHSR